MTPQIGVTLPIWRDKIAAQIASAQAGKGAAEARLSAEQIALAVEPEDDQLLLAVPGTAVLDSRVRKLVYVEKSKGQFAPVEIVTGPRTDDSYPLLSGLSEGDKVVTRGNFLLDSQFQIRGLPSLYYKEGQAAVAGHQHGAAGPPPAPPASGAKPQGHEQHKKEAQP